MLLAAWSCYNLLHMPVLTVVLGAGRFAHVTPIQMHRHHATRWTVYTLDMSALDSELLLYNCSPSSGGELSLSGCPAIPLCALVRVGVCVCVSVCVSVCLETGDDI